LSGGGLKADLLKMPVSGTNDWAGELAPHVSSATVIRRDEPMAKHTTLRVGGPADVWVEPASEADLAAVLKFCGGRKIDFFILGRGSNLLVRDGGFRGVVICLAAADFCRIEVAGERLRGGAGAKVKAVVGAAKLAGLGGLEFLEGIPGSVGGALRMNAGAMGGAVFDVVESVRGMDRAGNIFETPRAGVPAEYRSCPLFLETIALAAVFKGVPAPQVAIEAKLNEFSRRRRASQPARPSAGCTFKNPAAIPAGRLIEELGLKGARVGGAMVAPEHGNFLVNAGGATAADVLALMARIQARARAERGIELQPEVEIVGENR
jgi:UDP-N-acetylenolpyruvoylglucosamine reductase